MQNQRKDVKLMEKQITQEEILTMKLIQSEINNLKLMSGEKAIDNAILELTIKLQSLQRESNKSKQLSNEQLTLFFKYFSDKNYWQTLPDDLKSELYKMFVNHVKVLNGNIISVELHPILQQ